MADQGGQEKTERATPKKRRDERKKGHVAMSKDVVTVVSLIGIFCCLRLLFPLIYESLEDAMVFQISAVGGMDEMSLANQQQVGWKAVVVIAECVFPLGLLSIAFAVLGTGVQTRFLFTWDPLKFKLSKLNPLKGIKNMFSLKQVIELLKASVKILILGVVLYNILKDQIIVIAQMMDTSVTASGVYVLKKIFNMVLQVGMVFIAIAGFDLFYQRWSFEKDMKMTKEEVKEEFKQTEGDPKVKGKIRSLQQSMARSRMMQAVPDADVIIRNPTHFAVALKYDADSYGAPIVLAKGQDELALRIVRVAEESGVAVVENPPLARGIYASTNLSQEIPQEFYGAVAEVLVYVYKMNNKME